MCFAPQRRALFRHLNFQKWSGAGVFCTFWLRNVLRATTACTFSTSQLPKVVRSWCVLYILTWKCASRQRAIFRHLNFQKRSRPGVFCTLWLRHVLRATTACNFSSHLPSGLRTLCFSEPTFRPSGATKSLEKHSVLETFLLFGAPGSSFFLDFLFFDLLSSSLPFSDSSAFHLSILSEVWLLNFHRPYIYILYYIYTIYIYILYVYLVSI